jgi:hypothetical protein
VGRFYFTNREFLEMMGGFRAGAAAVAAIGCETVMSTSDKSACRDFTGAILLRPDGNACATAFLAAGVTFGIDHESFRSVNELAG